MEIAFIDDVYSFNNIYIAWTISSPELIQSQSFQYRECGKQYFTTAHVTDVSDRYKTSTFSNKVHSVSLNNLKEDTVYEFQIYYSITSHPSSSEYSSVYRIKTLSPTKDDWQYYLQTAAPYVVGGVGTVILTEVALSTLGFGSVGITVGSVAAGIQSGIGSVEAGSLFAILQSTGMAGMSASTTLGIALSGAGIVSGIEELEHQLEDECENNVIGETLQTIQYYVMDQINTLDVKSWENNVLDNLKSNDEIQQIKNFVNTKYGVFKKKVTDKMKALIH